MSNEERIDRLVTELRQLHIDHARSRAELDQLQVELHQQKRDVARILNLLGLSLDDLRTETATSPGEFSPLLLRLRRTEN